MLFIFLALIFAYAILCSSDIHKGLWLLVAVLPSYLLRIELFGVPTTLLELLVITFLLSQVFKRKRIPVSLQKDLRILVPIVLLVGVSTISIVTSPDIVAGLGIWKAYFIEPILLFFVIRYEIIHKEFQPQTLFNALGLTAIVLSLVAFVQWTTGAGLPIPWDFDRRATSVFDYPNALGLFLGPIVVIGALHIWKRATLDRGTQLFWIAVTTLSSIAIVLAESEAAVVAVVATLFLTGILNSSTRKKTLGILLACVLLIALSPWRGFVIEKLTLQDYSGGVRLSQWTETVQMLKDHWFFGAGLAGYPEVFTPYHTQTQFEVFQYPHTILLNIWVELGLLGIFAFHVLAWRTVKEVISRPFSLTGQSIAFMALIEMIIHGLVDVPYFKNDLSILTWILLAIVFSYVSNRTSPSRKKN